MRILVLGDLAATGFGTVTGELGQAMLAQGADVRFVSLNQHRELPPGFEGRVISIGTSDGWIGTPKSPEEAEIATRRMQALFREIDGWSPEAAIVIGDHASVDFSGILDFIPEGFPALHYVPIEGVGMKPGHAAIWRRMQPVAMSEFGADQIAGLGLPRPPVVYHGVDTSVFHPATPVNPITVQTRKGPVRLTSRSECQRFMGAMLTVTDSASGRVWPLWQPGRVVMFRHDANVPRKRWQSLFRSLAPVLDANPDADLVYHTRTVHQGGDLEIEKSGYDERVRRRMLSTGLHDAGITAPRDLLAAMLNASDVYVSGAAEGFGLCIAEAIACGLPAVGMDYSSVPEVIGDAGLVVPAAGLVDNIYSCFWAGVREDLFGQAAESLVRSRGMRRELGARGPDRVRRLFRWDAAASEFIGLAERAAGKREAVAA